MNRSLDNWYALSARGRVGVWLLLTLSLLLLSGWSVVYPAWSAFGQQREHLVAQRHAVREQWPNVVQQRQALHTQAAAEVTKAFTPLDFQHPQAQLTRWQPGNNGGEMALEVQWERVGDIFEQLAQRNMYVSAFSLEPKGEALRLTLQLENGDES
ncbi:hypothetical protein [Enterobacter sp.]|uniref:HofO family protein n=1 Tax=Enterobacter sp. TaxID=42895 RepID=UPI0029700A62|nr:hypothetical protein [Enterobacter sp.]